MKKIILSLLLFSAISCSSDDEDFYKEKIGEIKSEIQFGATLDVQTRVSTDANFKSTFEDGDAIGIFAVKRSKTSQSAPLLEQGNYIHNVKLTYIAEDGGNWVPATSLYYVPEDEVLDFYAYHPYDTNASNPTAISFNVQADQSGISDAKSHYGLSDLLSAIPVKGISKGKVVKLNFSHKLSLIQVEVPVGNLTGSGPSADLVAMLQNVKLQTNINLATDDISAAEGEATAIKMHRLEKENDANYQTSYTYRALVPSQTLEQGENLFRFTNDNRQQILSEPLANELVLLPGRGKRYENALPYAIHTMPIAAGSFIMGSPEGEYDIYNGGIPPRIYYEILHKVTLTKNFRMGKYAITNAQYACFLNDRGIGGDGMYETKEHGDQQLVADSRYRRNGKYNWGLHYNVDKWEPAPGYSNHPAIYISWTGATEFASWIGGSLPTEAQWEYACRAGTTTAFSFGTDANIAGNYAWYWSNSSQKTHPVGQKKPNPWGLYDMHGSTQEWCLDSVFTPLIPYSAEDVVDPIDDYPGVKRIARGGEVETGLQSSRSASRFQAIYYILDDPYGGSCNSLRIIFQ